MKTKNELIHDALAMIHQDGEIVAMKWLADQIEAINQEQIKNLLTKIEARDRIIHQMKTYG